MDSHIDKAKNTGLVLVLVFMIMIIVGLIIGIVFVRNDNNGGDEEEPQTEEIWTDSSDVSDEEKAKHYRFIAIYNDVAKKAEELYSHGKVSADEIMNLYNPVINTYLGEGDFASAQTFILLRNDNLISRDFKKEALDALLAIDYNIFPEVIQNRYYNKIINLAKELNEKDIEEKYQVLADKTKAAVEAASRASAEWAEKMQSQGVEEGQ